MTKRPRRQFTDEFKAQMVQLYLNGKLRKNILQEYELTASSFDKWVKQSQSSGSFREKDNKTPEQLELEKVQKENKRLRMENEYYPKGHA